MTGKTTPRSAQRWNNFECDFRPLILGLGRWWCLVSVQLPKPKGKCNPACQRGGDGKEAYSNVWQRSVVTCWMLLCPAAGTSGYFCARGLGVSPVLETNN